MTADSTIVSFGELELAAPDVVRWTSRSAINEMSTSTIELDAGSRAVRSLALNEPVGLVANEHGIFGGTVTDARVEDGLLIVNCSSAPQMETQRSAGLANAHHSQLIRLIVMDADCNVQEADDSNEICPAATRCLDWDAFLSELTEAPDFLSFAAVLQTYLPDTTPSEPEQRLLSQVLGLVQKAVADADLADAPAATIKREHYEVAFPKIWACSWRYRRVPDEHEITVPLQHITAGATPLDVGTVIFSDADADASKYLKDDSPPELITEWSAKAYARTVVQAQDLWTAKSIGLARIREALTVLAFAYTYAPWQQKLNDGDYRPVSYQRPAGAPGTLGSLVRVVSARSSEYWLGPVRNTTDSCDLERLAETRGTLLAQASGGDESNELRRHVQRALSWRYRAQLASDQVDAFLYTWISLEMLFQRPSEKTPDLVRRLPFAVLSVGDRPGAIRTELQRRWIPLRDEIVHRAILSHDELATGVRRVQYLSDCAIGYALAWAEHSSAYDDWLAHLDDLSIRKP